MAVGTLKLELAYAANVVLYFFHSFFLSLCIQRIKPPHKNALQRSCKRIFWCTSSASQNMLKCPSYQKVVWLLSFSYAEIESCYLSYAI